jgi:diamine oxidase
VGVRARTWQDAFSFDDYFNSESLAGADVVTWASLGMHHIPTSEDFPSVTTAGSSAALVLRPFNFFDEDPSMDLSNAVYVTPGDNGPAGNTITSYAAGGKECLAKPLKAAFNGNLQAA